MEQWSIGGSSVVPQFAKNHRKIRISRAKAEAEKNGSGKMITPISVKDTSEDFCLARKEKKSSQFTLHFISAFLCRCTITLNTITWIKI